MIFYDMYFDIYVCMEYGDLVFDIKLIGKVEFNFVILVFKVKDIVVVRDIEEVVGEKISVQLIRVINMGKYKGVDIFRLGYCLEWRYLKIWEEFCFKWIDYVKSDLQFYVIIDINI